VVAVLRKGLEAAVLIAKVVDTEGESKDGHDREARTLDQRANRVPDILAQHDLLDGEAY
jgi:hypothetical protein